MADCAHCGQSVQEADNFCIKCGHPVEKKVSGSIDDVLDVVKPGQDEQPGRSLRVGDESTSVNMGDVYVQRGGPSDEHARYCRSCGNFVAQDVSYRCPQCGVFPLCWKHFNEQDRVCAVCSPNAFTQGGSPGSTTGISGTTRSLGTTSAPTETASQAPTPVPSPAPQGIAPPPALTGVLERSIAGFNTLPLVVQSEVGNLSLIRQEQFADEYRRKRKSLPLAYLLWFILAAHYVYLGRWPMTLFLWVTLFFTVGIIWWVVDIFRMPGMVRNRNNDVAIDVLRTIRIIGG